MKERHEKFSKEDSFCVKLMGMLNFFVEGKFFSLSLKLLIPLIPIGVSFLSGFNYLFQYDKKIIGVASISDFYRYFFLKTPPENLFIFLFFAITLYLTLRMVEYREKSMRSFNSGWLKLATVPLILLIAFAFLTSSTLEYTRKNDARYSILLSDNTEKKCFRVVGTVGYFLMVIDKKDSVRYINLSTVDELKKIIDTMPFYRSLSSIWVSQEKQKNHRVSYVEKYDRWADRISNICGETPPPISVIERPVEVKQ